MNVPRIIVLLLMVAITACHKQAATAAPPPAEADPGSAGQTSHSPNPSPKALPQARLAVEGLPDFSQPPRHWPPAKNKAGVHYHNGKLVEDNSAPTIEVISEFQEPGKDKLMVPAYPGDLVYMSLQVQTELALQRLISRHTNVPSALRIIEICQTDSWTRRGVIRVS